MATTLNQWEVGPFNAGANISMLPTEIDDNEAVIAQDMLLDKLGMIYTRGAIKNVTQNSATFNGSGKLIRGIFSTTAPDGQIHVATVTQATGSTNLYFTVLSDAGNSLGISIVVDSAFPITSECVIDAKPALGGGVWIGTQELNATPNIAGRQCLFHWRGGTLAAYSTGTTSATIASTAVTGVGTLWLANVTPGMFLMDSLGCIGVVKSVNSNTSITLEFPANIVLTGAVASAQFISIRPWILEASKGRIKTVTGSTAVIGSGTKFLSTPFDAPHVWPLYRARDNKWIGSPSSNTGDEGMVLGAGATVDMDMEPYIARPGSFNAINGYVIAASIGGAAGNSASPGVFNTTYAGLQWFARQDGPTVVGTGDMHSRVWFSDYRNMNSIDLLTQDGDYIQVPSSAGQNKPITGIAATPNALLIFKETETFAITGDSPDTFALNKIWDDGCLSSMSIVFYHSSVIWAGRNGVYIFDGTKITNLIDRSMGTKWKSYVTPFDPRVNRMSAAVYGDHLLLSPGGNGFGAVDPYTVKKSATSYNHVVSLCIYLPTKALSFFTDPDLRGSARTGLTTIYAMNNQYVGDFSFVFPTTPNAGQARDFPDQGSPNFFGPDPVFESKWFSMKDPLRKKMFKQVMASLDIDNQVVTLEIAPGLYSSALSASWTKILATFGFTSMVPATSRLKFLKRDRYIRIKLYQDTSFTSGFFALRRLAIGYKLQKLGRL